MPNQALFYVNTQGDALTDAFSMTSVLRRTLPNNGRPNVNFDIGNITSTERAFWTFDALVTASKLHNTIQNAPRGNFVAWRFPYSANSSYTINQTIRLLPSDWNNWDSINHEYGHIVAQSMGFFPFTAAQYVTLNAPMSHEPEVNSRSIHNNALKATKLAFSEGFGDFYSMVAQKEDPNTPTDAKVVLGDGEKSGDELMWSFTVNLGFPLQPRAIGVSNGQDEELTVMRILWDLYDSNSPTDDVEDLHMDQIQLGFNGVLNKILGGPLPPAPGLQTAFVLNDLWRNLTIGTSISSQLQVGSLFELNNVSPHIDSATDGMFLNDTLRSFIWDTEGPPQFRFTIPSSSMAGFPPLLNNFEIRFFDQDLNQELLTTSVPLLGNNILKMDWQPNAAQWDLISANLGTVKWFVGGRFTATDSAFYWSSAQSFDILSNIRPF